MTGTDKAKGIVPSVVKGGTSLHFNAPNCISGLVNTSDVAHSNRAEKQEAGASQHRPASTCTNEGDGTRTRNHRLDSSKIAEPKPLADKAITAKDDAGRSAGRSDLRGEGGISDPDLNRLVNAWPTLPAAIRRAMLAMIDAE